MQLAITSLDSETLEIYIYKCLAYKMFKWNYKLCLISSVLNIGLLQLIKASERLRAGITGCQRA
jgi:hypothetical protein